MQFMKFGVSLLVWQESSRCKHLKLLRSWDTAPCNVHMLEMKTVHDGDMF